MWDCGILDWDCIANGVPFKCSPKRLEIITRHTLASIAALDADDPVYFSDLLPPRRHWRLFPEFRHAAAYVDIETTGLDRYGDAVTTIALYDGVAVRHYVSGRNLDDFADDIRRFKVIVTYNGKSFDAPFIAARFGPILPRAHIDLRHVLKSLGYGGGLKSCERALGVDRGDLSGMDGAFAVLLWQDYQQNGNEKALETLLAYNIADVVNLEALMVAAYNMKIKKTPFCKSHELPAPDAPDIPFKADLKTVDRLKRYIFSAAF